MENTSTSQILSSLESLYLKKKFREAKLLLLDNKKLFSPGHFSYNMGTLYAKTNSLAAARYHLEKAKSHGFYDTKLINNLEVVKSNLNVSDISNSPSWYDRSIDKAMGISDGVYLSFTLIFVLLIMIFIKLRWIKQLKIMVLLLCLSVSPYAYKKCYLEKINFAISLKEVVVREGPSAIYGEINRLKAGTKFLIGDIDNGWLYIKYPLSQVGWVYRDKVALY